MATSATEAAASASATPTTTVSNITLDPIQSRLVAQLASSTFSTSTALAGQISYTSTAADLPFSSTFITATGSASYTSTATLSLASASGAAPGHGAGLDTGAAAGIGVGATLGTVALAGLVGAVVWRRRRRARRGVPQQDKADSASSSSGSGVVEQVAVTPTKLEDGDRGMGWKMEKDGSERFEAPEGGRKVEKDGCERFEAPEGEKRVLEADGTVRAELDGGWTPKEVDGGWGPVEIGEKEGGEKK